jgi:hypothetical protein
MVDHMASAGDFAAYGLGSLLVSAVLLYGYFRRRDYV